MNPNIQIEIKKIAENQVMLFSVVIKENDTQTEHKVSLNRTDLVRFNDSHKEPEELIQKSFEYLLQKEKKEKIPQQLDFTTISRYFPEFSEELEKIINE